MTVRHNHIVGNLKKPVSAETQEHEIVINDTDGTLWSKDLSGKVQQVGGSGGGSGGGGGGDTASPFITSSNPSDLQLINKERHQFYLSTNSSVVLPISPKPGDTVSIGDASGTFSIANKLEIKSAQKIESSDDNLLLINPNIQIVLSYIDATIGWKVVDGIDRSSSVSGSKKASEISYVDTHAIGSVDVQSALDNISNTATEHELELGTPGLHVEASSLKEIYGRASVKKISKDGLIGSVLYKNGRLFCFHALTGSIYKYINGDAGDKRYTGVQKDGGTEIITTNLSGVKDFIITGYNMNFVLYNDGELWASGLNYSYCLGLNSTIQYLVLTKITGIPSVVELPRITQGMGYYSGVIGCSMAVKCDDGYWYSWGNNSDNGTGYYTLPAIKIPTKLTGSNNWLKVWTSMGGLGGLCVWTGSELYLHGRNNQGCLGTNSALKMTSRLNMVNAWKVGDIADVVDIKFNGGDGGDQSTDNTQLSILFKNSAGKGYVRCCGDGEYGKNGNNLTSDVQLPVSPIGLPDDIVRLESTCNCSGTNYAIASNGNVWAWGRNIEGQCGVGNVTNQHVPVKMKISGLDVIAEDIVIQPMGYNYEFDTGVFIKQNGEWYATGFNGYGQSGVGDFDTPITSLKRTVLPKGMNVAGGFRIEQRSRSSMLALDGNDRLYQFGSQFNNSYRNSISNDSSTISTVKNIGNE